MNLVELKNQIKAEKDRAYSLKTKKAQSKAWTKIRDLEREAIIILYTEANKIQKHSVVGTVAFFRDGQEFIIKTEQYGSLWVSPANDVLAKSWYEHTCCIEYTQGQEVSIEVTIDVDQDRLCLVVVPGKITGGRVNETQYAELCKRDDLAFFKYPTGQMSGLFSNKKSEAV